MQFDLVSPERALASLAAASAELPGSEGDMTVMPDHAPVLTALCPGILTVASTDGETHRFVISGGTAEITGTSLTVLAEQAFDQDEVDHEIMTAMIGSAAALAEAAEGSRKDALSRYHARLVATGSRLDL
ncbi:MAG: ATP synthase F1 subunit epsilon [Rhodobacteraceae bacterium]|nr:ATP synthase F1 subunit epsilon [Paracoccaceae bacterium]